MDAPVGIAIGKEATEATERLMRQAHRLRSQMGRRRRVAEVHALARELHAAMSPEVAEGFDPFSAAEAALWASETNGDGDDAEEHAASWRFLNVVKEGAQPPEPPSVAGLLYPSALHLLSGEFDSGKSWTALYIAACEVREGRRVVWIDTDSMGAALILERLRLLGLGDEDIASRFLYLRPDGSAPDEAIERIVDEVADGCRVVIIDSMNSALAGEGLDPVSTPDVDAFFGRFAKPAQRAGAAVLILDHLPKASAPGARYAFGSQRKTTGADVHLSARVEEQFRRGEGGSMRLRAEKDRPGFHGTGEVVGLFKLTPTLDGTGYLASIDKDISAGEDGWRPTRLIEAVSMEIEKAPEPMNRRALYDAIDARQDYVKTAIEKLIEEGFAEALNGPRNAKLVASLHPYRQHEDAAGAYGEVEKGAP